MKIFWEKLTTWVGSTDAEGETVPPYSRTMRWVIDEKGKFVQTNSEFHKYHKIITASSPDGDYLYLGFPGKWKYTLEGKEIQKIFFYLLWEYFIKARWFGLRRPLYFWIVNKFRLRTSGDNLVTLYNDEDI